jgi:hypothetical protein
MIYAAALEMSIREQEGAKKDEELALMMYNSAS